MENEGVTCGGDVAARNVPAWQLAQVVDPFTNCNCPARVGRWHDSHATTACADRNGKRVSWCMRVIAERSMKARDVWQRAQSAPSSPLCTSRWHEAQVAGVSANSSVLWQLAHVARACAPVSGNAGSACVNVRWMRTGFHEFGA
jgi:hypothetical protein